MNEDDRCYFRRTGGQEFVATALTQGAWNSEEQHIAPALGLITHVIETDAAARRRGDLKLGRLSFDILGTIPIGAVVAELTIIRPGRTIELVEARLTYAGRTVVLARAWLMQGFDTTALTGTALPSLPSPDDLPLWDMTGIWSGGCVNSIEVRREEIEPGRAKAWLRTDVDLVAGEAASPTARALGIVDIANGIATRVPPGEVAFPNLDLTVHLFRQPEPDWLGMDTTVSFGPGGIGLTHSVIHDAVGAFGTVVQCLTVRPR